MIRTKVILLFVVLLVCVGVSQSVLIGPFEKVVVGDANSDNTLNIRNNGEIAIVLQDSNNASLFADIESNGALAVNIQDQHSRIVDLKFIQIQSITSLTINATKTLTLTDSNAVIFVDGTLTVNGAIRAVSVAGANKFRFQRRKL